MKGQSTDGTVARDQLAQNGTALEQSSLDKDLLMENRPISTTQMSSYLGTTYYFEISLYFPASIINSYFRGNGYEQVKHTSKQRRDCNGVST